MTTFGSESFLPGIAGIYRLSVDNCDTSTPTISMIVRMIGNRDSEQQQKGQAQRPKAHQEQEAQAQGQKVQEKATFILRSDDC